MAAPAKVRTTRQIVRAFLADALDGEDRIDTLDLILRARQHFDHDNEFQQALLDEALAVLVSTELEALVRNLRDSRLADTGDARAKEIAAKMFEHVGGTMRKSLLAMTRPDLRYAANEREHQAVGLLKWARFERALAKGLRDDTTTVDERYSDDAFDTIWREHFEPA